ncbi:hypothetical protein Hydth_0556 [Hydrogenobacter thermophilus TK-6]|uniref:Large polyvalent protein associated domain-containing protein n=1 Tax=Hydrogenobacter thermophilus (strain DSM 6534 / IAM 12695 / TK-6) TaxID=608538 RepID=D3DGR8_HYDTT|nr:hypothetical protein [Hydrogenobacter thermophilus]ADO44956.1 hypothetical protein Hydth_0556 [Hydrogenobacter thermophilus TK-6]BAI69020.1 hypothetical protein HTH_0558 [Hydrogenobacter thermophilus TK-6]
MPNLEQVLSYLDPAFANASQEQRNAILNDLKGNPQKIDKVLSYLDPQYAKAPPEMKTKILKDLSGVSLPEKIGRAFAYGAGELAEDMGQILKKGRGLVEKLPFVPKTQGQGLAETLIQLGQEAKSYWIPEQYKEVYDFPGSSIVQEIPSLIGFSPVLKTGGAVGKAIARKLGQKGLTEAIAENVGAGLGYSATQATSGDYTGQDVLTQTALDVGVGAGGYTVGKWLSSLLKGKTPEQAVKVLDTLEAKLPEGEQKEAVKLVKQKLIKKSPQPAETTATPAETVIQKPTIEELTVKGNEKPVSDEVLNFYAGGPSTEQLKGLTKVPEDPLTYAKDLGVEKPAKEARAGIFANAKRWVLPQYEWLKETPETASVYRAAKDYTEGFEKDIKTWLQDRLGQIKETIKNLPDEDRAKIVDYVEGKTKELPESYKPVANQIRQYLDDIYNYAKGQGLNISYRKDYFPHIFDGHIRVQVGDEFKSAKTWDEALEIAKKGIDEGQQVNIKAMLPPSIYELRITNPRFWSLVNELKDGVELTTEEVKGLLQEAGIGRRPKYRFVSNLLERKYDIDGYIKDPEVALPIYTFNIIKKIHQDRFLSEFEKGYEQIKDPRLRRMLDEYKTQVLGYPTKPEEVAADTINAFLKTPFGRWFLDKLGRSVGTEVSPYDVRRIAGQTNYWLNYLPDLGLSISSALVNSTQTLTNTLPILGAKKSALAGMLKYTRALLTDNEQIKKELFDAGILTESSFEGLRFSLSGLKDLPMSLFSGVEVLNRVATYGAAKEYGLREGTEGMLKTLNKLLGVPEHDPLYKLIQSNVPLEKKATEFAKEVVDKTQFRYEKFQNPRALGSLSKLALPYKTYLINQLLLSYRMLTGAKANPREAILFFAAPVLLAGKDGNPLTAWTWGALNELYGHITGKDLEEDIKDKLGKAGDVLLEGLPKQVGVDIRGAVKLDFPNPFDERFYGRPGRILKDVYDIAKGEKGTDALKEELTPKFVKSISQAYDIIRSGYVKDNKGRVIKEGDWKDALLTSLGVKPTEYYDFLEKKDLIYKMEKKFKNDYEPLINEYTDSIISGDEDRRRDSLKSINSALQELNNKIQNSEGQRQKAYLYLYLRLAGALKDESLIRRMKERLAPSSGDKYKQMLIQEE